MVTGQIDVDLALVGSRVEKFVASEFHKSMHKAVAIVEEMIDDEGLG